MPNYFKLMETIILNGIIRHINPCNFIYQSPHIEITTKGVQLKKS